MLRSKLHSGTGKVPSHKDANRQKCDPLFFFFFNNE